MQTNEERRTAEEIEYLKESWRDDPIWDIEDTEDFEAYYEELLEYRLEVEREWDERRRQEIEEKAERLGVPGNVALAGYVDLLEMRLEELSGRVERLEEQA